MDKTGILFFSRKQDKKHIIVRLKAITRHDNNSLDSSDICLHLRVVSNYLVAKLLPMLKDKELIFILSCALKFYCLNSVQQFQFSLFYKSFLEIH